MALAENQLRARHDANIIQGIVRLPVPISDIQKAWQEYQALRSVLQGPGDFQLFRVKNRDGKYEEKEAPTKQWANKLSRFFSLNVFLISEELIELKDGQYAWKVKARAEAPNGQFREAEAICHSSEKVYSGSRAMHDTYTTAATRAKNRAVLELVAFGEVSAEELEMPPADAPADRTTLKKIVQQYQKAGFSDEDAKEMLKHLKLPESLKELKQEEADQFLQFIQDVKDGLEVWPPLNKQSKDSKDEKPSKKKPVKEDVEAQKDQHEQESSEKEKTKEKQELDEIINSDKMPWDE